MKAKHSAPGVMAAMLILLLSTCGAGFRTDELECDEAVAHLVQCCPNVTADTLQCVHVDGCETATRPELDADQSECIRSRSCAVLRQDGVCDRVARLHGVEVSTIKPATAVCP